VDQTIVIRPTADPVEPRFEQAKLGIAKVDRDLLEEENGKYLLFDDSP